MAAPTWDLTEKVVVGDRTLNLQRVISSTGRISLEESVATGQTNRLIAFTLDVSQLKGIIINSTKDVTFETNSGSSPADTIALLANVPYVWHYQSYHPCLLTTDVTGIYITNASGATATINIEAVYDATV